MPKRFYGWTGPGLPRKRFPALSLTTYPPLVPTFNLVDTGFDPPIWDQGQTSGCVGHGTTAAAAYLRAKQGLPYVDLSRIFSYYNARLGEGHQGQDDGASVGDGIAAIQQYGICPYNDYPTDPAIVTTAPSLTAYSDGLSHRAIQVTRILGATPASFEYHLKHCISVLQVPVVFGFTVFSSFESDAVAKSGIMPVPDTATEQVEGGHCVCAVAFDDNSKMVRCRNSWSASWGQAGYFYMPYSVLFDPDMASDFHAILAEVA